MAVGTKSNPWLDKSRKLPTRIELWVDYNYPQQSADKRAAIVAELLQAASEGATIPYHTSALAEIFPELQIEHLGYELDLEESNGLQPGYAETSTRRYPREPETVVVGSKEIAAARYVGVTSRDGHEWYTFRAGRRFYFQLAR